MCPVTEGAPFSLLILSKATSLQGTYLWCMFFSVKLQARKSKLAELSETSLGSSMQFTMVSSLLKWLPYMKQPEEGAGAVGHGWGCGL